MPPEKTTIPDYRIVATSLPLNHPAAPRHTSVGVGSSKTRVDGVCAFTSKAQVREFVRTFNGQAKSESGRICYDTFE